MQRQAGTSLLVYGEVMEYLKGLPAFREYKARLQQLFALNQITPYPLTYPILERYGDIRRTSGHFTKTLVILIRSLLPLL